MPKEPLRPKAALARTRSKTLRAQVGRRTTARFWSACAPAPLFRSRQRFCLVESSGPIHERPSGALVQRRAGVSPAGSRGVPPRSETGRMPVELAGKMPALRGLRPARRSVVHELALLHHCFGRPALDVTPKRCELWPCAGLWI
jgi:hypothetical protein